MSSPVFQFLWFAGRICFRTKRDFGGKSCFISISRRDVIEDRNGADSGISYMEDKQFVKKIET